MLHPATELKLISAEVGYGVFATALIPAGTLTWVLDDLDIVISEERLRQLNPTIQAMAERFSFRDNDGRWIVCWDFGRFMNHSCEASTAGIGCLCDVALRDIRPGEQLTCEYAYHNLDEEVQCRCGASKCRGVIRARDLVQVTQATDRVVGKILSHISRLPQPLTAFMAPKDKDRLDAILSGQAPVPTSAENLFTHSS